MKRSVSAQSAIHGRNTKIGKERKPTAKNDICKKEAYICILLSAGKGQGGINPTAAALQKEEKRLFGKKKKRTDSAEGGTQSGAWREIQVFLEPTVPLEEEAICIRE